MARRPLPAEVEPAIAVSGRVEVRLRGDVVAQVLRDHLAELVRQGKAPPPLSAEEPIAVIGLASTDAEGHSEACVKFSYRPAMAETFGLVQQKDHTASGDEE